MNEFDLIEDYLRFNQNGEGVIHGIGDDAAVLELPPQYQLVISTDTMVQSVHFDETTSPADLARKLFAVNASDMAAMSAIPKWITVNLSMPAQSQHWLKEFASQFHQSCLDAGVSWVGGDLTTHDVIVISATICGWVERDRAVSRAGAKPGDLIYVSGSIGDAALALRMISTGERPAKELAERLHRPSARIALGRAVQTTVSAMIDCSDGLLQDLQHICNRSGVSAKLNIDNNVLSSAFKQVSSLQDWQLAVTGGDDYELIMTVSAELQSKLEATAEQLGTPLHCIGEILPADCAFELLVEGLKVELPDRLGYQHFGSREI